MTSIVFDLNIYLKFKLKRDHLQDNDSVVSIMWRNKVAVVTGASAGIGAQVVKDLIQNGMIVAGLARRSHLIEKIQESLPSDQRSRLVGYNCDVRFEESIKQTFQKIEMDLGGVDVLVNNAAYMNGFSLFDPKNTKKMADTINTNILGVALCARETVNSMKNRATQGYIIHMNSILGSQVPVKLVHMNVYCPSKYAMTALTETLRLELKKDKLPIRITNISPGFTRSELTQSDPRFGQYPYLLEQDVSRAVVYCLNTPPSVEIKDLRIQAVGELG